MKADSPYVTAPHQLTWHTDVLQAPEAGDVLIRTVAGAISSGTELPQYMGTERSGYARPYPQMTGYESVGVVVACGEHAVGDRVLATYGHRTAALVSASKAYAVPDDMGDDVALLAILGCDVMSGIRKLQPVAGEQVLVSGCGTIGLLAVWSLGALGIEAVDVIEPIAERRELALALGARRAVVPGDAGMLGDGHTVGVECSSRNAAFQALQRAMQPGGRVCVLADGNIEPLTLAPQFHMRELQVLASSDGWDYRQHAEWHWDAARRDAGRVRRIFDHSITANELPVTFESMATGAISPVKVLVRYQAG